MELLPPALPPGSADSEGGRLSALLKCPGRNASRSACVHVRSRTLSRASSVNNPPAAGRAALGAEGGAAEPAAAAEASKKTEPLTGCGHEASHTSCTKMLWCPLCNGGSWIATRSSSIEGKCVASSPFQNTLPAIPCTASCRAQAGEESWQAPSQWQWQWPAQVCSVPPRAPGSLRARARRPSPSPPRRRRRFAATRSRSGRRTVREQVPAVRTRTPGQPEPGARPGVAGAGDSCA